MKKRLAIFTHGGIGAGINAQGFPLITQLVNRLAEKFELTVFSLNSFNEDFEPNGYTAFCVPKNITLPVFRLGYLIGLFFKQHLKKRYDVLYSFWGYPMGTLIVALGKMVRKPSLVNILGSESADVPEIKYGSLRKYIPRKITVWTCNHATELIAVSLYQMKILAKHGVKRDASVIPWGVKKELFSADRKETALPLKLIHVGNLTPVKDQVTLINAFRIIRENIPAKLRIIGPDYMDRKLQKIVENYGLQQDVAFMGFILNKDIVEHYHWADVFMLTSLSEGQNNSITEAMMCGVLPVSTSVGHMDDLGNSVGVVEKPGDYKALANGVIALYKQPQEWAQKRQAAHTWATVHDFEWTVKQLENLIHKA